MTQEQRTRVYCCFKACPTCGAKRGEYCLNFKGRRLTKGYHWRRGPFSDRTAQPVANRKANRERYEKLVAQIRTEDCNQFQDNFLTN